MSLKICSVRSQCSAGRAASDVGWREECGNEHPWVIEDAIRPHGVDGSGDVGTTAHSPQPSLFSPPGQTLGSAGTVELEGSHHVIDVNDVAGRGQHSDKLRAASGEAGAMFFHGLYLA